MFSRKITRGKGSQTDGCCCCTSKVRCNKNTCTQFPEVVLPRRALSSIDFIPTPHKSGTTVSKEEKSSQFPEETSSSSISVSAQGSSLYELDLRAEIPEEDPDFDTVIRQFAKYPLRSEYQPPRSKSKWPAYKSE